MSLYGYMSLACFALVAYDLYKGKIWGNGVTIPRGGATRSDDPRNYWLSIAAMVALGLLLAALAISHVPEPR